MMQNGLVRSRASRAFFLPSSSFLPLPIGGRRFDGEPRPPRQCQEVFISRDEDSRASAVSVIEQRLICQIAAHDGALPHPVNRLAVHEVLGEDLLALPSRKLKLGVREHAHQLLCRGAGHEWRTAAFSPVPAQPRQTPPFEEQG